MPDGLAVEGTGTADPHELEVALRLSALIGAHGGSARHEPSWLRPEAPAASRPAPAASRSPPPASPPHTPPAIPPPRRHPAWPGDYRSPSVRRSRKARAVAASTMSPCVQQGDGPRPASMPGSFVRRDAAPVSANDAPRPSPARTQSSTDRTGSSRPARPIELAACEEQGVISQNAMDPAYPVVVSPASSRTRAASRRACS